MDEYLAKALINKKTKQISIALQKKKYKILKDRLPKAVRIKIMGFEF
jgi:hypothetical protein